MVSGILEYKTPISNVPKGLLLFNIVATSIIDENDNELIQPDVEPLRNDTGVFLAFENPFDEESNLDDIDQQIKIDNKSTLYKTDLIWNNVLDREFSELWKE